MAAKEASKQSKLGKLGGDPVCAVSFCRPNGVSMSDSMHASQGQERAKWSQCVSRFSFHSLKAPKLQVGAPFDRPRMQGACVPLAFHLCSTCVPLTLGAEVGHGALVEAH